MGLQRQYLVLAAIVVTMRVIIINPYSNPPAPPGTLSPVDSALLGSLMLLPSTAAQVLGLNSCVLQNETIGLKPRSSHVRLEGLPGMLCGACTFRGSVFHGPEQPPLTQPADLECHPE